MKRTEFIVSPVSVRLQLKTTALAWPLPLDTQFDSCLFEVFFLVRFASHRPVMHPALLPLFVLLLLPPFILLLPLLLHSLPLLLLPPLLVLHLLLHTLPLLLLLLLLLLPLLLPLLWLRLICTRPTLSP